MNSMKTIVKRMLSQFTDAPVSNEYTHSEVYSVLINTTESLKDARKREYMLIKQQAEKSLLMSPEALKMDIKIAKMQVEALEHEKNDLLFLFNQIIRKI